MAKPAREISDRIIDFYTAQVENEAYAKRLAIKAAALGSEGELQAEADRMVDHYPGRYPSREGSEGKAMARVEAAVREYRDDVILRLRETDSYAWGLAVAGIMHLWERAVRYALMAYMRPVPADLAKYDFRRLCDGVEATGYAVRQAPEYPDLRRSLLIANATKHGEGDAREKLRTVAPEMFEDGEDEELLWIGRVDFDRAVRAVDKFWPAYEDAYSDMRDRMDAEAGKQI